MKIAKAAGKLVVVITGIVGCMIVVAWILTALANTFLGPPFPIN